MGQTGKEGQEGTRRDKKVARDMKGHDGTIRDMKGEDGTRRDKMGQVSENGQLRAKYGTGRIKAYCRGQLGTIRDNQGQSGTIRDN